MIEDREVITTFVTVAWQEARTRHFVCWSLQAFVNYLKGTVTVNTRATGTRRNVGRQRAIVYVGNYAKSRIKCNVREQHAQRRRAATRADEQRTVCNCQRRKHPRCWPTCTQPHLATGTGVFVFGSSTMWGGVGAVGVTARTHVFPGFVNMLILQ